LLSKMLEFNPNKRISAEEILSDPYFDDVRIPEQENYETCEIDLKFDDVELSIEELRNWVVEELKVCSDNYNEILE
jgi:serine/threonine protein kinase